MWFFDSTIEAEKVGGWSRSEAWLVATRARRADREGMNRLHKVPDLPRLEIGIDFVFLRLCEFLIAVSRLGVSLVASSSGQDDGTRVWAFGAEEMRNSAEPPLTQEWRFFCD